MIRRRNIKIKREKENKKQPNKKKIKNINWGIYIKFVHQRVKRKRLT